MDNWVTWALQALIASILVVIWNRLETNTAAVNNLSLELARDYLKFQVWDEESKAIRKRLHDIEDYISGQKAVSALERLK